MRSRLFGALALLLIAVPALAADRAVQSGIDPWRTPGNGRTFIDFATIPLPAGFFCYKSEPFTGRVVFRGIPIATGEEKVLGNTDTIVQRLDEAVFDKNGVANTRVQVRALHFESVQPIKTACGDYNVEVRLNGAQPITKMRIVRESDHGGRFYAPIAVNGKLVFTPVRGGSSEILEITRNVRFPANQGISWADQSPLSKGIRRSGFIQVDTDNDRVPDTFLPGTSTNFAAGVAFRAGRVGKGPQAKVAEQDRQYILDDNGCHIEPPAEGHCPEVPY